MPAATRAIITADDFGLSIGVNEAVEQACRQGLLSTASLMIAGPAAADAVRRARTLPQLHVGLHLVVLDGDTVLPGPDDGQLAASIGYALRRNRRRQLAAEIRAQYAAYAQTGLQLDHANAHKHMHMHPTVGRLLIEIGRDFGLRALRIPHEPAAPLRRMGTGVGLGGHFLNLWSRGLRRRACRAGLVVNKHAFGIAWSGHMTTQRLLDLVPQLPPGLNEIYFHPATHRDERLQRLMPSYEHEAELATLLSPALRDAIGRAGVQLTTYGASLAH